jgi:predicted transcriptional regulator
MENDSVDTEGALVEALRYEDVLRALNGGSMEPTEVEEVADVSTSTAHRILDRLEQRGVVDSQGSYRLTPLGEALLHEVVELRDSAAKLERMRPVAELLPREIGFDPSHFDDGKVTVSDEGDPYEPEWRLKSLLDSAEEVRLIGGSSSAPVAFRRVEKVVSDGGTVAVVCPEDIASASLGGLSDDGSVSVYVHGTPTATVALTGTHVYVGAHDTERGEVEAAVDTDGEDAYVWGERVYERYREEADEYP